MKRHNLLEYNCTNMVVIAQIQLLHFVKTKGSTKLHGTFLHVLLSDNFMICWDILQNKMKSIPTTKTFIECNFYIIKIRLISLGHDIMFLIIRIFITVPILQ